jgi:ERCC4-type nuclease
MTIKNVTIGDKFIASNDVRSKRISTVVDFLKIVSVTTGKETGDIICVAEKEFMGKKERFETPFATVVRSRIK